MELSGNLTQLAFDEVMPGVTVENRGIAGTLSQHLVEHWPTDHTFTMAVDAHGINDCFFSDQFPVEVFKANLRTLVKDGITVLEVSNPIREKDCSAYRQATRDVAAELRVPLIDTEAFLLTVPGYQAHIPDGVHPDQWLLGRIAENRVRVLAPLVCKEK